MTIIVKKTWPYQFLISIRLQTSVQNLADTWVTTSLYVHMLCMPSVNSANKIASYHSNENAVAGVGRLNFLVVNKSAKVKKVEIELAASPMMALLNSNC